MSRILALAIGAALLAGPALADSEMRQSPLLMRRAGPSCRPGNLGAEPGAGSFYRLGPCAGAFDAPSRADRPVRPAKVAGPAARLAPPPRPR